MGRTITVPRATDGRPVRFAFVLCNSVNEGAQNAYRRMIWEDERAPADRKLGFVLHLGDFIYVLGREQLLEIHESAMRPRESSNRLPGCRRDGLSAGKEGKPDQWFEMARLS